MISRYTQEARLFQAYYNFDIDKNIPPHPQQLSVLSEQVSPVLEFSYKIILISLKINK